jgi:hypothetical protein
MAWGAVPPDEIGFRVGLLCGMSVSSPPDPMANAVTVSEPLFATYRNSVSGESVAAAGFRPTGAGLGFVGVDVTESSAPLVPTRNAVTVLLEPLLVT